MTALYEEHPVEYPKGTPVLQAAETAELARDVPGWSLDGGVVARDFAFRDFNQAFGFVSRVALLAEAEGHHPDISISWNRVRLVFWTHSAGGLTRNDFIMAAKVNRMIPPSGE